MLKRLAIFDVVVKVISIIILTLTFAFHSLNIVAGEFVLAVMIFLSFIITITMHMEVLFPIDRKE